MNSFTFYNAGSCAGLQNIKNGLNKDFLLDSAGNFIVHAGQPMRRNGHNIIDMGDCIRIQSGTETIYLDKNPKEENNWAVTDELIKEDVTWWEKFKRKFK